MTPLDLAMRYMEIFFSGSNLDRLYSIFADELIFDGPLMSSRSAGEYVEALKKDPPRGMSYQLLNTFENKSGVCLIYLFQKGEINTPMAQYFEIRDSRIQAIRLIFDRQAFA